MRIHDVVVVVELFGHPGYLSCYWHRNQYLPELQVACFKQLLDYRYLFLFVFYYFTLLL